MSSPLIKEGDVVILNSPRYNVKNCKAAVILYDGMLTVKPLDDTKFPHGNFTDHHQHFITDGDNWKLWKPFALDEELFTI